MKSLLILPGFLISSMAGQVIASSVVAAEYYIDTDPGQGSGTPVAIPLPSNEISLAIDVAPAIFSALPVGDHRLAVRLKDSSGNWSEAFTRSFRKDALPISNIPRNIARVEYQWFLANVPVGNPVVLMPSPAAPQATFIVEPSIQSLTEGLTYQLVVTPVDSNGTRGESVTRQVAIQTTDSDGDGLPDRWETLYQFDPTVAHIPDLDSDNDGLSDLMEYQKGTDPRQKDTSGDGLSDGFVASLGLDPKQSYPTLRAALLANSTSEFGFVTEQQIRDLSPGKPLLKRDAATGKFTLTMGLQHSSALADWQQLPMSSTSTIVTDGNIEHSFSSDDSTQFYRVTVSD